jgi:hypothetical protein
MVKQGLSCSTEHYEESACAREVEGGVREAQRVQDAETCLADGSCHVIDARVSYVS